ncbi:MAG: FkbM family methyltransferase [Thermodesulfovibrionales bacterium]
MLKLKRKFRKWLYGKCPGIRGAFPYYGTTVYFPKNSVIFNMACDQGTYEHEIVRLLLTLVKPNTYFFDVGANIGLISVPILFHIESSQVVSFEPSPNALPFLMHTFEESKFRNRWKVIGKAANDQVGEVKFTIASVALGAYDGIHDTMRAGSVRTINVPATTLDLEWEQISCPNVSAIKIDVEGAELLVLKGAQNCIENCQPYILLEWNAFNFAPYHSQSKDLLSFAKDINYKLFSAPHLIPIDDETTLAVQMLKTENFLLVPKN